MSVMSLASLNRTPKTIVRIWNGKLQGKKKIRKYKSKFKCMIFTFNKQEIENKG